jgi:hypothetical protein
MSYGTPAIAAQVAADGSFYLVYADAESKVCAVVMPVACAVAAPGSPFTTFLHTIHVSKAGAAAPAAAPLPFASAKGSGTTMVDMVSSIFGANSSIFFSAGAPRLFATNLVGSSSDKQTSTFIYVPQADGTRVVTLSPLN